MELPETIESERIILKRPYPATFDLANRIYDVLNKSRNTLGEWLPWVNTTHSAECMYTNFLIKICQESWENGIGFAYLIMLKSSGEIIGVVDCFNVSQVDKCGEIGYWLSDSYVGNGYMQEAVKIFQDVAFKNGFYRLYIKNDTKNLKSVHVPEKLGYHLDGVLRQERWDEVHQCFNDTNYWSLLSTEWDVMKEKKF